MGRASTSSVRRRDGNTDLPSCGMEKMQEVPSPGLGLQGAYDPPASCLNAGCDQGGLGPGLRVHISDQLLGDADTMDTWTGEVPGDPSGSEVLGDFSGPFQDWEGGVQERGQSVCHLGLWGASREEDQGWAGGQVG